MLVVSLVLQWPDEVWLWLCEPAPCCNWLCDCDLAPPLRSPSRIQVSLVPPPWDELTTSEPSFSATRVRPPGAICTSLPESTKGRRSMWRGAMPASTKVGELDRLRVGWAM